MLSPAEAPETGGGGWIRTNVGARPTDLQSAPFSRSGTPPAEPEIILSIPKLGQPFAGQVPKRVREPSERSAAKALQQASHDVFGLSGVGTFSKTMLKRPVGPETRMVCVLSLSAGSATTFRRVRSQPMPASDSTAAMFTFCGK